MNTRIMSAALRNLWAGTADLNRDRLTKSFTKLILTAVCLFAWVVPVSAQLCGDGICEADEDEASCLVDCAADLNITELFDTDSGEPFLPFAETDGTFLSFTDPESNVTFSLETTHHGNKSLYGRADTVTQNPKYIEMFFEEGDTESTTATIHGLNPNSLYHLYKDSYENHQAFIADASGSHSFTQDTSNTRHVWIQEEESHTVFVTDITECATSSITGINFGSWDPLTRTCTLTSDLTENVEIAVNDITLDGAGHTISGSGSGTGILLTSKSGVTIKNCNVQAFANGIFLSSSAFNTLTNNTVANNGFGIYLSFSPSNTLTNNTVANNTAFTSINLFHSPSNTLTSNIVTNTSTGINVFRSSSSILTNNTVNYNGRGIHVRDSSFNTIKNNQVNNNGIGISLFVRGNFTTVTGNQVNNNRSFGIRNTLSSSNTIANNTANNNGIGIRLFTSFGGLTSTNVSFTNNTANNNRVGISVISGTLDPSQPNVFTNNIANDNTDVGIRLINGASFNIFTNNTANNNTIGMLLSGSTNNTLTDNTMNFNLFNFDITGSSDAHFEHTIATSNTVDGKPILYVKDITNTIFDSSTNAGTFYCIRCDNVTINDLALTNNGAGVTLVSTNNSIVEGINANNNNNGIRLILSSSNTIANNTANSNVNGIQLLSSSNANTLSSNFVTNNGLGIRALFSNGNLIFNNFFDNSNNAFDNDLNSWNITKTAGTNIIDGPFLGGNFWSDYLGGDLDSDTIGDTLLPYNANGNITNGGDFLPLTTTIAIDSDGDGLADSEDECPFEDATGLDADGDGCKDTIGDLINLVHSLNLQQGIQNSLDKKLEIVQDALDAARAGSIQVAINLLNTFINEVKAQKGKELTDEQADLLIAMTNNIIAQLS